jgi:hypothetical protein
MFDLYYKTIYLYERIKKLEDRINRLEDVHQDELEGMRLPYRLEHPDTLRSNPFGEEE